ncbi:transcriptional regulator [Methanobrevibacter ruminantium M1]|uniref:Putative HTH-type transcriptional regulatory protein mru_0684 n=1 Tax=Methanobrevibacter ruminantium (strain ATCC 35063 / DSM 1093 / JCM 13430 / OCM 146 / M1) TaxID=634498 RepID=D3E1X4_METRM|nr:transcriptional regulator [Methanobrevibacter ruminantium]ADC46535.1 transcriptional regulator [Methanobrevibacter ruminantium M1]
MAVTNRNQLIREVYQLLNKEGFETSNIYDQSCFDIVARKKLLILLLKILVNIDSINESHVEEIRQISNVFLASPIIVGLKSKNHILEEDVVYERHGLPAIGLQTLKNMIIYDEYPEILADRGGYYVQINGNVLKEYREEYNLSLKDLADLAHVSRATMYKYENGMVRANTETAMLLEEILNTKITLDIDLFEPYQEDIKLKADTSNLNQTQGTNAQNLAKLGFGVVSTNKSPFDALAKAEIATKKKDNPLIANLNVQDEQNTKTLKKMAISLKDLSLVTSSDPFFVLADDKIKDSIDGIPVIKSWEMKEFENSKEFLKLIKERRNN